MEPGGRGLQRRFGRSVRLCASIRGYLWQAPDDLFCLWLCITISAAGYLCSRSILASALWRAAALRAAVGIELEISPVDSIGRGREIWRRSEFRKKRRSRLLVRHLG